MAGNPDDTNGCAESQAKDTVSQALGRAGLASQAGHLGAQRVRLAYLAATASRECAAACRRRSMCADIATFTNDSRDLTLMAQVMVLALRPIQLLSGQRGLARAPSVCLAQPVGGQVRSRRVLFRRTPKAVVGLDIGSSAVKAVELKPSGKGFKVAAFASEPVPADSIVDG